MLSDPLKALHNDIVELLASEGAKTPYKADANEPDPRYFSYGVRAPQVQAVIKCFKPRFGGLELEQRILLAKRLIESAYGEQQTVALHLLERSVDYFTPDKFDEVDQIVRRLYGWSKVDSYTGSFLRTLLETHPKPLLKLVRAWNADADPWPRRASVVLFTRKVARSGLYTDTALRLCDKLKHAPEDLVRKGVGWCLKDLMRHDKARILPYVKSLREQGVSSTITLYALRDLKGKERDEALAAGP